MSLFFCQHESTAKGKSRRCMCSGECSKSCFVFFRCMLSSSSYANGLSLQQCFIQFTHAPNGVLIPHSGDLTCERPLVSLYTLGHAEHHVKSVESFVLVPLSKKERKKDP